MIYIIVALKTEAQAFVDKYKLKNYTNGDMMVVISGIGVDAMFRATTKVLQNFTKNDVILNVGICGASKKYKIVELIDARQHNITCVDSEVRDAKYDIVDMESFGFYNAVIHSPAIKSFYIQLKIKIISFTISMDTILNSKECNGRFLTCLSL